MNTSKIDTWLWVLIYSGLVALGLGLSVRDAEPVIGHGLLVTGIVGIAAGIVLIYVRSRMKDKS